MAPPINWGWVPPVSTAGGREVMADVVKEAAIYAALANGGRIKVVDRDTGREGEHEVRSYRDRSFTTVKGLEVHLDFFTHITAL